MTNQQRTKKNFKGFAVPILILIIIISMLIVAGFTTNAILFQFLLALLVLVMAGWMIVPLLLPGSFKGRTFNK